MSDRYLSGDLVQNDPWLRGNEIRMYSRGSAADRHMMAQLYREFHRVYADRYGTVWSEAPGTNRVAGRIAPRLK